MNHEQHVGEPGAKISSICVVMPGGLGCVDIHTFGAVQLHHGLSWDVWQACEKCGRGRNPFKYEIKTPAIIGKQSLVDQSYPHLQENLDSIKTNSICFVLIGTASQIQLLCLLITDLKTNKQTKQISPKLNITPMKSSWLTSLHRGETCKAGKSKLLVTRESCLPPCGNPWVTV